MSPGTIVEYINPLGYNHYRGVVERVNLVGGEEWVHVNWDIKVHPCTTPMLIKHLRAKCLVHKCENFTDQGRFVGDLCAPCHQILTTGYVGPTSSFLGEMNKRLVELENEVETLREPPPINNPPTGWECGGSPYNKHDDDDQG
jgi:hypothetical protein